MARRPQPGNSSYYSTLYVFGRNVVCGGSAAIRARTETIAFRIKYSDDSRTNGAKVNIICMHEILTRPLDGITPLFAQFQIFLGKQAGRHLSGVISRAFECMPPGSGPKSASSSWSFWKVIDDRKI